MGKIYNADLHIHSCLSPCGDLDMTPRKIVAIAIARGLDIIAISDHNASENILAAMKAAEGKPLTIIPAMEVASAEEAHLLVLFEGMDQIQQFQKIVYDNLLSFGVDQRMIDDQVIVNENDEVEGFNEHLLFGAVELSLQQLVSEVHRLDGLAIASHIDRESFSIIGQLGFVPNDLSLDGLEISYQTSLEQAKKLYPDARCFPLIKNSDAHYPNEIGRQITRFFLEQPTLEEIRLALKNSQGRKILE
ncbi:MAG: PHP domain-containing protein [candidate division KSB1 bacterium]|nr:PHP domain-containing protein [candidate division KSB1 bacterium]MDZ7335938.1 PHP domain-containing protein [candidate division KSB1 bacterium]MDZ7357732.1 PHP domain-containing protein [candidate division KSB1 bacterium]MDZ7399871.1 PHP domain-containing protein [candidate division KSB1 bacterium]